MKAIENLIANKGTRFGNHSVVKVSKNIRNFVYHSTVICKVNDFRKTFWVDNGGWGTSSTKRAMNIYVWNLSSQGYSQIAKGGK